MNFVKMHGTGNDFVVLQVDDGEQDWMSLAIAICDRHFGIGSDGLILARPSRVADLRMQMFNPDGSEAEMCGNGIRCLAKYAVESRLVEPHGGSLDVETLAGTMRCELTGNGGAVDRVRVAMGAPRFRPVDIPVRASGEGPVRDFRVDLGSQTVPVTCVSMGNPHAVHFSNAPVADFALRTLGPLVEHHEAFPKRVNFEVVNCLERGHVRARVWERGAGETLACGTGACAIGVASVLADLSDGRTTVSLPGGDLEIEWDGRGDVFLSGPATEVYRGEWLLESGAARAARVGVA
jgi:diaminopimelate epimerase